MGGVGGGMGEAGEERRRWRGECFSKDVKKRNKERKVKEEERLGKRA